MNKGMNKTIPRLFSESWALFQNRWKVFVSIYLLLALPVDLVLNYLYTPERMVSWGSRATLYMALIGLGSFLLRMFAILAVAVAVKNKKSVSEAYATVFAQSGRVIGTSALYMVLVFLLSLLLIVPGIIFGVYWAFVPYAIIFKKLSGKSALNYSKEMVKGRWWKVFLYVAVISLGSFAAGYLFGLLPSLGIFYGFARIISVFSIALAAVVGSYASVWWTLFYLDFEKNRSEHGRNKKP